MKKNKIYVNEIKNKLHNNQKEYDVKEINNVEEGSNDNSLTVKEKIDKIFQRNGYVFNVIVEIITKDKTYNTKIAGMVNDYLITLDDDIINIKDINNIIIKN